MKAALIQLTAGDDPAANLPKTQDLIARAAREGAGIALTPEVTNCVSQSRTRQKEVLTSESADITRAALSEQAAALGIWILAGSLALDPGRTDGRFVNRSILIGPDGAVRARYDKIHMFDVTVSPTETYRESAGYAPGEAAVVADIGPFTLGLTICYDLRFPRLFRALAHAGAGVISVPSAFSPVTGAAHWETLLRARAIETGCYILAPAQTGTHPASRGRPRRTYGHSLAVAPWGEVIADAGTEPGVTLVELDPGEVEKARARVPSLSHDREFSPPR